MSKKLIIYPLILIVLFIISKLILNLLDLEYQSQVYYALLILIALYILAISNYHMLKTQDKLNTKIFNLFALNFITLTVVTIIFVSTLTFYGYDYKIDNNHLRNETLLQLRPSQKLYTIKNFFLKSKTQ